MSSLGVAAKLTNTCRKCGVQGGSTETQGFVSIGRYSRDEKCELSMVKMLFVCLLFSFRQIHYSPSTSRFSFAQELVKRTKKNGSRFLGKCGEGLWYVMKDKDARKNAIQGKMST
jgi:hypothetical protein